MLAETGIDNVQRALGNGPLPKKSSTFDIFKTVKVFDPSLDSGACRVVLLVWSLKVPLNS